MSRMAWGCRRERGVRAVRGLIAVAFLLELSGCGDRLVFYSGDSAEVAVGTTDIQCPKGGVEDDGPGLLSFASSAPDVVSVERITDPCLLVTALTEGEATITVDTSKRGSASILIRAVPADEVALGLNSTRDFFVDSVVIPTAASYTAGSVVWTNFVWLSGGLPLRGSSGGGFSLTDPTVASLQLSTGDIGGLNCIEFTAQGTSQVSWNGVPGPVLNVVP
jgi:hypothetical protein